MLTSLGMLCMLLPTTELFIKTQAGGRCMEVYDGGASPQQLVLSPVRLVMLAALVCKGGLLPGGLWVVTFYKAMSGRQLTLYLAGHYLPYNLLLVVLVPTLNVGILELNVFLGIATCGYVAWLVLAARSQYTPATMLAQITSMTLVINLGVAALL